MPSIPYIPEKDVIQEAVDSSINTLKLTLPYKVDLHIPVWSKGIPEKFLVHVQQALDAIRQKCLLAAYEKTIKDQEECAKKLTKANDVMANYMGEDASHPEAKAVQTRCSSYTSIFLQRKLGNLKYGLGGADQLRTLDRPVWKPTR